MGLVLWDRAARGTIIDLRPMARPWLIERSLNANLGMRGLARDFAYCLSGSGAPWVRAYRSFARIYRFFSNERVSEADILSGHFQSTRDRTVATDGRIRCSLSAMNHKRFSRLKFSPVDVGAVYFSASRYCLRQPNSMLRLMLCRRATPLTVSPLINVSATSARFSSSLQHRRA
jgi:hypothetical protein